jgi:hypothetical protein
VKNANGGITRPPGIKRSTRIRSNKKNTANFAKSIHSIKRLNKRIQSKKRGDY